MTRRFSHDAVLLGAGGSARLGQPKQELTIDGEPLLRRAARLLAETKPTRLFVVLGDRGMATHLDGLNANIIENPDWPQGLSTSVRSAARAIQSHKTTRPVLFSGVDQCRLQLPHLDALLRTWAGTRDVVTRYDAESYGIPALISRHTLAQADNLTGDRGFGQIWQQGTESPIFVDAPELGFDLDTPAQLAIAIRHGWIDGRRRTATAREDVRIPGLRELKQARVRTKLIAEAMHLFAGRGFEAVTVDEIAAAAGVSRRTLFRYFDTKGDIVFAWASTMTDVLRETMAQAAPDEQPGPAMRRAFTTVIERIAPTTKECLTLVRLIEQSPALRVHSLRKYAAWEESIIDAWRDRLPAGDNTHLAASVLARSSIAAFRAALEEWLRCDGRTALAPLLARTFELQRDIFDKELHSVS